MCVIRDRFPERDYLLAVNGCPMKYIVCLSQLRRCLAAHAGLDKSSCALFTLHSLKTTLLGWSHQLNVPEVDRAAQGHHRSPGAGVSRCVPRYGRDDIEPQLRCQRSLLRALDEGWVPRIPLARGLHELRLGAPAVNVGFSLGPAPLPAVIPSIVEDGEVVDSHPVTSNPIRPSLSLPKNDILPVAPSDLAESGDDTEAESESDESCFPSDAESVASADSLADLPRDLPVGPWLLNIRSGVFHKTISKSKGSYAMACRPQVAMHDGLELRKTNPRFEGFSACRHSGCCHGV